MKQIRLHIILIVLWLCAAALMPAPLHAENADTAIQPDTIAAMVTTIQEEVEVLRGLQYTEPLTPGIASKDTIHSYLERALDEDPMIQKQEDYACALRVLGYLSSDESLDLRKLYTDIFTEQIAGFYDEKNQMLYVSKKYMSDDIVSKSILAHEMCHALQDQHFALETLLKARFGNEDQLMALMSVIEGDATILMSEYQSTHLSLKNLLSMMKTLTYDQEAFSSAPYFIQARFLFPYLQGMHFVNRAIAMGGTARRNSLFEDVPESTEQILHPEKYYFPATYDEPTTVSLPKPAPHSPTGWSLVLQNTLGEYMIRILFEQKDMRDVSTEIAQGWDGDAYGLYSAHNATTGTDMQLVLWRSVWDSEDDAREFFEGYSRLQMKLHPSAHPEKAAESFSFTADSMAGTITIKGTRVDCLFSTAGTSRIEEFARSL